MQGATMALSTPSLTPLGDEHHSGPRCLLAAQLPSAAV